MELMSKQRNWISFLGQRNSYTKRVWGPCRAHVTHVTDTEGILQGGSDKSETRQGCWYSGQTVWGPAPWKEKSAPGLKIVQWRQHCPVQERWDVCISCAAFENEFNVNCYPTYESG